MHVDGNLHIPAGTFTAFRLTYCCPQELSQLTCTLFLGQIPDIWAGEKSSNIIARATARSKQSVRRRLKSMVTVVHSSVTASASKVRLEKSPLFVGHGRLDPDTVLRELEALLREQTESSIWSSNSTDELLPEPVAPQDTHSSKILNIDDVVSVQSGDIQVPAEKPQYLSVAFAADTETASRASRQRISITEPTPAELDRSEFLRVEEQHKKFREKLKQFARKSKGQAKQTKSDIQLVVYRRLLTKFKAGQVVRVDKMLVLIKEPLTKVEARHFTENEPCDTRVVDRWKEYHVALRRTDDNTNPLEMQLYDLPNFDEATTKTKPKISISLSCRVSAQFYSRIDKTISVWVGGKRPAVYILACKDQVTAVTWLYFVSQFIGYSWSPSFQICIPDLDLSVLIYLSELTLLRLLGHQDDITVTELEFGYDVQKNPVFDYLRDKIRSSLAQDKELASQFERWQTQNPNPLFCHKYYDRLEWASNNGGLLAMQHQLLGKWYKLEYRQAAHLSNNITTKSGEKLVQPPSLEGFLSRLSSPAGHEFSLYRTFYKTLYFYSHRGLLFYTKYYRGTPPSTRDPRTYYRKDVPVGLVFNPYELDEKDHIPWLRDNYAEHNAIAEEEFERKALQVIKAEGVIDLCRAQSIEPIDISDVRHGHRLLLASLWYSNTSLATSEEIVDSSFVIEMVDGERLKLQAPNREARDEWVERLKEIRNFWVLKQEEILKRIKTTSEMNQTTRKINEYIDSNATEEMEPVELQHSFADPEIHNIEPLAMKYSVSMYGYLFLKTKMHANFRPYFVVLSPGFILLFKTYHRSKLTGASKKSGYYRHFLTIPIAECYLYSGASTAQDLLNRQNGVDSMNPGTHSLPRVYPDGWKSSEEEPLRCFTLSIGEKRAILKHRKKYGEEDLNNPGMLRLAGRLGITGRSMVFMARSRQERELWVHRIFCEIDRFAL